MSDLARPTVKSKNGFLPKTGYRPDIDGLRAIAVVAVVLFHLDPDLLPGGYIGVDVFFVISGYLITNLILRDLELDRFSLKNFWVRRIRRLIPASLLVTVAVLIGTCFLLGPNEQAQVARSAASHALMASNIYFWRDTGYFADAAHLKPLLHTWSLAIEEQFYIIYPIVLIAIYRFGRRFLTMAIIGGFVASLLICIVGSFESRGAAFYLLPARAWELLAGGIACLATGRFTLSRSRNELLSMAGILAVAASVFLFSDTTPFPSPFALIPVAGSMLLLFANAKGGTMLFHLLSWKPLRFIGLISYSLYLWHWPFIVFSRFIVVEITPLFQVGLVVVMLLTSTASWYFIENYFRFRLLAKGQALPVAFASFSVIAIMGLSFQTHRLSRTPPDESNPLTVLKADIDWYGIDEEHREGEFILIGKEAENHSDAEFFLWGDSHQMMLRDAFDKSARQLGLTGLSMGSSGLLPVTDLWNPCRDDSEVAKVKENAEAALDAGIRDFILIARWSLYCEGPNEAEQSVGAKEMDYVVRDSNKTEFSIEQSADALRSQLSEMIDELEEAGVTVWIFRQVPEANRTDNARRFYLATRFPALNNLSQEKVWNTSHLERQKRVDSIFSVLGQRESVNIIDPFSGHFDGEDAYLEVFGTQRSFYRDDDHLTREGVERYMQTTIDEVLSRIKEGE